MAKERATVEHCDNPACDYWELVWPGEVTSGYHLGKGVWANAGGGGPIPKVYAHSKECIAPAVDAAIERTL